MNFHNNTDMTSTIDPQLFEEINGEFANEISYGLEYILDEVFPEKKTEIQNAQSTDWFGLSDLMI